MNLEKRYSQLPDIDYPNFRLMFDAVCDRFSSLPAARMRLADGAPYTTWYYADLRREAYALGRYLLSRGLAAGDRVVIVGENRPEWCFAYVGVVVAGLVAVPTDSTLDAEGLAAILAASGAKAAIYSRQLGAKAAEAVGRREASGKRLLAAVEFGAGNGSSGGGSARPSGEGPVVAGAVPWSVVVGTDEGVAPGTEARLADGRGSGPGEGLPDPESIDGNGLAVIIYTSGTTGVAKGIMLSHRGIIANVNASIQALNVGPDDTFIGVLPLHHTYAATCNFLSPFAAGGSITFVEKIVPSVILRHVRESRVTFMIGVPLLFDKIKQGIRTEVQRLKGPASVFVKAMLGLSGFCLRRLRLPAGRLLLRFLRAKAGIATVRLGVAGGGPLAWDTAEFFEILGFNLVQGYGMSENGPLIAVNLPEYKDNRSVGLPVKRTEARIADPGPDGVGEIQVRSPSMMLGYLDAPEATAAALSPDGWLRTGDLGYIDGRGFVFITGRSKNIIVTEGGKNVYPEEIEMRFEGSPWVREVLVLGRPVSGAKAGEQVIAVCVPDWDRVDAERGDSDRAAFAAERVRDEVRAVNKTLASFMKIVDVVLRDDEFEKTSTRKVRRFLYQHYAKPVAAGSGQAR